MGSGFVGAGGMIHQRISNRFSLITCGCLAEQTERRVTEKQLETLTSDLSAVPVARQTDYIRLTVNTVASEGACSN